MSQKQVSEGASILQSDPFWTHHERLLRRKRSSKVLSATLVKSKSWRQNRFTCPHSGPVHVHGADDVGPVRRRQRLEPRDQVQVEPTQANESNCKPAATQNQLKIHDCSHTVFYSVPGLEKRPVRPCHRPQLDGRLEKSSWRPTWSGSGPTSLPTPWFS